MPSLFVALAESAVSEEIDICTDDKEVVNLLKEQSGNNVKLIEKKEQEIDWNSNVIIAKEKLEQIKEKKEKIQKMIRNRKLLAVFEEDGLRIGVEEKIGFPITVDMDEQSDVKVIARIYNISQNKKICISDITVPSGYTKKQKIDKLFKVINESVSREPDNNRDTMNLLPQTEIYAALTSKTHGIMYRSFQEKPPYGDIVCQYDMSTVQDIGGAGASGKDFYLVYGNITIQPGRKLYNQSGKIGYEKKWVNQYLDTEFELKTTGDIVIAKLDTSSDQTAWSVSLEGDFDGKRSAEGSQPDWSRYHSDCSVTRIGPLTPCFDVVKWHVHLDAFASSSKGAFEFEPGIKIETQANSNHIHFCAFICYTVDSWNTRPRQAALTVSSIHIYPDRFVY